MTAPPRPEAHGTWRRLPEAFARCRSGVAAVEFAVLAPVLLALWFLMVAVTTMVIVNRKMTLVSRSLADLTARSQTGTVTQTELGNIFAASASILYPYSTASLQMVVSSVRVNTVTGTGAYVWSCGRNITARPARPPTSWSNDYLAPRGAGDAATVPSGFEKSASFIMVETRLRYTPIVNTTIGTRIINDNTPWPVRNTAEISLSGGCPANT